MKSKFAVGNIAHPSEFVSPIRGGATSRLMAACVALCCFAGALPTSAEENVAIWKDAKSGDWGVPGNWVDASGAPLEVAPTNGTHDIRLPAAEPDGATYTINTGALSGLGSNTYLEYPAVNPSILSIGPTGGVWDTWRWVVEHPKTTLQYRQPRFRRVFTIADASGFDGYWSSAQAMSIFDLSATAERTPQMSSLYATCRPYVRVPSAGTSASLQAVSGVGTVSKLGDGELRVGTTQGGATRFTVDAGTLTLEGRADGEVEALCRKAALHLDATRADTILTTTKVTDGVEYQVVTNWADANGSGIAGQYQAYSSSSEYYFPYSHGAFVSPVKSPTGLPLVDFGSHVRDEGRFGPSNCWLKLNREIKDPTAVFYAVQTPGGAPGRTILGTVGDTGFAFLTEANDKTLFCAYDAGSLGRNGDIMINGDHVTYDETANYTRTTLTNLNVISVAVRPGAIIGTIGADRTYTSRSCGSRLGEVLVFTNALTRAERVRIAQHLVRKWMTGASAAADADAVVLNEGAAAVGVPDGRRAEVGEVVAVGGTLTKTGGGTLAVGTVLPKGAKIRVEGGAVAFMSAKAPAASAPASDPYVWLDATDAASLETTAFDGDGRSYVAKWRDHRDGVDVAATAVSNSLPRMPWVVSDIGNGRGPGVSLGARGTTPATQSHFILPTWGADGAYGSGDVVENDTYAGFIVYRNNERKILYNIFGSSNMDMFRSTFSSLLCTTYAAPNSPSAFWSVNGRATDPFADIGGTINQTNDVLVVAFRSATPLTVNAIAKDRKGQQNGNAGCITVGEFITYHRPLSAEEFRATEAYLMAKWLGEAHPSAAAPDCSLEFASDAAATLDSDADVDLGVVSGGSGAFVKRGSGAVTATAPAAAAESVEVEEGSLSLEIDKSLCGQSLFHFDASREDTLATYAGDDGKTYVTSWRDAGGRLVASSLKHHPQYGPGGAREYEFVATNPTLEEVEMPDGALRKVVNFGKYMNVNWTTNESISASSDSASMYFATSEGGAARPQDKVREVYVVQRNNDENRYSAGAHFIGNLSGGATKAEAGSVRFMRGTSAMFSTTYTSLSVQDGYIALDRVPKKASDPLTSGWHLVSVGATNCVCVDAMMQDRNCNVGGGWIAEMIAFDHELTAEQRADIERHLMRKWGIGNEEPLTQPLARLAVEKGSSLAISGVSSVTAATLGGGGTLAVADTLSVAPGGSLSFEYRGADDVDCLSVNGAVDLSGVRKVTVKLDLPAGGRVAEGEWTLLSATGGLTGLDLAQVELVIDGRTKLNASLRLRDGALRLRFTRRGAIVIVR